MLTIPHASLKSAVKAMLTAMGSAAAEAETVADHLVKANLKGHDSHGVGMMPLYIRHWREGKLVVNGDLTIKRDDGPFLMGDASGAHGQVVALDITRRTVERAQEQGVGISGLTSAHHIGRVGTYGEVIAEAGFVGLQFVNVAGHDPTVAPWAGSDARFLTNPVCISVPASRGKSPIILDFATSKVALGKVRVAYNEGRDLAPGLLIDHLGESATDPALMFPEEGQSRCGALTPMGEYKGSGLALMAELLGAALTGGMTIRPDQGRDAGVRNNMLSIVIDPDRLGGRGPFLEEVAAVVDWVKASPAADPDQPVLVAGEPELRSHAMRLEAGIPIDDTTWAELQMGADMVGMGSDRFLELARAD